MDIQTRLEILEQLYAVYDRFQQGLGAFSCREGCACCCTCNVTLTTLEAIRIVDRLAADQSEHLFSRIRLESGTQRFRPTLTTNAVAERIRNGESVPDEGGNPDWGDCVLLADALCPIYETRPFGCRSFFSTCDCRREGAADVPPLLFTVNTLFLQTVEHIDRPGCTGNLVDVLLAFASEESREQYRQGRLDCINTGLLPNRPTPVLMVPPEHRDAVMPVIQEIRSVKVPGG